MCSEKTDAIYKKCILILDDEIDLLSSLKTALITKYDIMTSSTYKEAFECLEEHTIDLVLLDVKMPVKNGLEVLEEIKTQFPYLPVIMMTGHGDEQDTLHALKLGASAFLKKPFKLSELFNTIHDLVVEDKKNTIDTNKTNILVVDDDQVFINSLKKLLDSFCYNIRYATSAEQAQDAVKQKPIDILVVDLILKNMNGFELIKKLETIQPGFVTIVITGFNNQQKAIEAIKCNVFDYIKKPFSIETLNKTILKGSEQIKNRPAKPNQANTEVQKQHHFIHHIIRAISSVLLVVDLDANILLANEATQQTLGYSLDELKKLNLNDLLTATISIDTLLKNSKPGSQICFDDEEMIKKDKSIIPVSFSLSPMFNSIEDGQNFIFEAHDISYQKKAESNLKKLAYFDSLTRLPNQAHFEDFIQREINLSNRKNLKFALLLVDLDHFTSFYDTHGELISDNLLQTIAKRMKSQLRREDFVARLGKDKFSILISNLESESSVCNAIDKLNTIISAPYTIDQISLTISASIGVAFYPLDGIFLEDIINAAEIAMYQAKQSENEKFQYHTQALCAFHKKKLCIENEIASALDKQQLNLVFKPIQYAQDKTVFATEASLEWKHPDIDKIPSNLFLPIAIEKKYMYDINRWIIKTAFKQFSSLKNKIKLSINIFSQQIYNEKLFDLLLEVCETYNIKHEDVILELTDSVLLKKQDFSLELLNNIRKHSFNLALAHFDIDCFSLSYIKTLPINILKIDRFFIESSPDENVVRKIILESVDCLRARLNTSSTSKDIEMTKEISYLKNSGEITAQGFYFKQPIRIIDLMQ